MAKLSEKERKVRKALAQKRWKENQKLLKAASGGKAPKAKGKAKSSRGAKIKAAWAAKKALAAAASAGASVGNGKANVTGMVTVKIGAVSVQRTVTLAEATKVIESLV